jgi:hypothetical protein
MRRCNPSAALEHSAFAAETAAWVPVVSTLVLKVLANVVSEGGLGDDIADLPVIGSENLYRYLTDDVRAGARVCHIISSNGKGGCTMFEEELLNNVMERCNNEFEEETYRKISRVFVEEHLKLLKQHENKIKSQIGSVSEMLESFVV